MTSSNPILHDQTRDDVADADRQDRDDLPTQMLASPTRTRL